MPAGDFGGNLAMGRSKSKSRSMAGGRRTRRRRHGRRRGGKTRRRH